MISSRDHVRRLPRAGIAVMWALVVLSVLAVMITSAAWHFIAARHALVSRQNKIQALWLARSGGELAVARLLADPDGYTGEIVEPIPESQIRITVEKDPARPDTYRIRSEVQYPESGPGAIGLTLTWTATRRSDPATIRLELVDPGDGKVETGEGGKGV